jgi:membrane protein YdbS with pleckstrin-like domain
MNQTISQKLHPSSNPLAAYAEAPRWLKFQDQEPDEQMLLLLRRHVVTNVPWVVLVITLALLPTLFAILNPASMIGLEWLAQIPNSITIAITNLWYLIVAGIALENFLVWYFNVYLISNKRLVDVDFMGLLSYSAAETELSQIQDVEHRQGGIAQAIFNFGTVNIQTAGTQMKFIFELVPNPSKVADIITDLIPEEEDRLYRQPAHVATAPVGEVTIPQDPKEQP